MEIQKTNYSIITVNELEERSLPELDCLADEMNANGDLLKVDPDILREAIRSGHAAIVVINADGREVPIAISRLVTLISDEIADAAGIPKPLREVRELGSVFVRKDYRSQGFGTLVQKATLGISQDKFANSSQLVIGTTKEIRELGALAHNLGIAGVDFKPAHHFEYPFVGPLTCVCKPADPPFGTGRQFGEYCPQRVDRADVPEIIIRSKIPRRQDVNHYDTHIACTMFVSSEQTAQKFNQGYEDVFGTPQNLVRALKEAGYYE